MKDKKTKRTFKPEKLTVRLNERCLPEIKDLEVGEETTITLKVKMISKSQGEEYGGFDDDGDYYETEYGKEYADQKRQERSQLKGSFQILSADEQGSSDKSPEATKSAKYNKLIKEGKSVSQARQLAGI